MLLLVSGASRTVARLADDPNLGVLMTPAAGNRVEVALNLGLPYACDNSAWSGFSEAKFQRMLGKIAGQPGCLWVACPDRVADAEATLRLFDRWEPIIRRHGLPVALVLQDRQERLSVPWDRIDAAFIGGTTGWKLGEHARRLSAEAKTRGKLVHMGRVNSRARIRYAVEIGCNSCDGSGWSRWSDKRLPKGLNWIREATSGAPGP